MRLQLFMVTDYSYSGLQVEQKFKVQRPEASGVYRCGGLTKGTFTVLV